jgi:cytochrome oxidase Cu insertion factor (SCO1/SenC/PrrC family)
LTDQDGRPFDSGSLKGKVWVGSFFFTNCPGACWRMNRALAELQQTNPSSDARFVSITCDPDDDTPPVLAKYAEHFQAERPRWTFLTGDMDLIRRIGNEMFHVAVEHETHSDRAFIVDRKGEVRGRFRMTEPEQVEMFKQLLAQVEAEAPAEADAHSSDEPPTEADGESEDAAEDRL